MQPKMQPNSGLPPMDPVLRQIFSDVYRFRQKYQNPVRDQRFWDSAMAEMEHLIATHESELCEKLLLACYEDIEEEFKRRQK